MNLSGDILRLDARVDLLLILCEERLSYGKYVDLY